MNHDLISAAHVLVKGRVLRLATRPGDRIECLSGHLWLTQDGDRRDIVLESGEAFVVDRHAGVVASALRDTHYLILSAP